MRDMSFTIAGLLLLYYFLEVGSIKHHNLTIFMIMFFAYAILLVMQTTEVIDDEQAFRKKNDQEMSAEDLSVPQDIEETALLFLEPKQSEVVCRNEKENEQEDQSYVEKKDEQDISKEHEEEEDPFMQEIEKICFLVYWPLEKILPVTRFPEIALLLVFVVIYFICEFIVTVMNVFSVYTSLSHFLVGLTLMVWGSDILEMFNMIIAVKDKKLELGFTAVLTCQVFCLLVVVPLACLMRMLMRSQTEIQILQSHHTRNQVVLPPIICSFLCTGIFYFQKMELDRKSALTLVLIYTVYVTYSIINFYKDE